jgi:hypothetical protein
MAYPYSWVPDRITPLFPSQVTVWDTSGARALLSTSVSVSAGKLSFALTNPGKYRISVRNGDELETGTFTVDITGTDIDTPEFTSYSYHDSISDLDDHTPAAISTYVRITDLQDPTSVASTTLSNAFVLKWQPSTVYSAGYAVQAPNGDIVTAITTFVSGLTYDPTKWNISPTYLSSLSKGASSGIAPLDASARVAEANLPVGLSNAALNATYAIANPTLVVTYNGDGTVASTVENGVTTTFAYNTDLTVNTQTRAGITKTFTYDASGNVTGAA